MTDQELLNLADKAKQKAYVPYSKFQVGAAILQRKEKYLQDVMWRILLMERLSVQKERQQSKQLAKDTMILK